MRQESILTLPGVGAARAKALSAAGFATLHDLALCLPKEYRDLTRATPIADLRAGEGALEKRNHPGNSARSMGQTPIDHALRHFRRHCFHRLRLV